MVRSNDYLCLVIESFAPSNTRRKSIPFDRRGAEETRRNESDKVRRSAEVDRRPTVSNLFMSVIVFFFSLGLR